MARQGDQALNHSNPLIFPKKLESCIKFIAIFDRFTLFD